MFIDSKNVYELISKANMKMFIDPENVYELISKVNMQQLRKPPTRSN